MKGYRAPGGQAINFVDGLHVKSVDMQGGQATQVFNVSIGADAVKTLYNWIVDAKAKLDNIADPLVFATNQSAVAGTATNEIITPAAAKAVLDQYVGQATAQLDTLREFALAIGNNPNYAADLTARLNNYASTVDAAFSGPLLVPTAVNLNHQKQFVTLELLQALLQTTVLGNQAPPSSPSIVNSSPAYSGLNLALTLSSVPNVSGTLTISSFSVQVDGGAAQTVIANNNTAIFNVTVAKLAGQTLTVAVTATDSAGKVSQVSTRTFTVESLTVVPPVVIYPSVGLSNVTLQPMLQVQNHPLASNGADLQVSGQHASTTWVIKDASNAVVWSKVGTSGSPDERYSVQAPALQPQTLYTLDVFFTVTGIGVSPTSSVVFTTTLPQTVPVVTNPVNIASGTELVFSVTSDAPYPDTSVTSFMYRIDSNGAGANWLEQTTSTGSAVIAMPSYSFSSAPGATLTISIYAKGNNGAESNHVTFNVAQVIENPLTWAINTTDLILSFDHPTVSVNPWTNVVDGNHIQGYDWVVIDMANSNQLALPGSFIPDTIGNVGNVFTIPAMLKINHQYQMYTRAIAPKKIIESPTITFTTSDAAQIVETQNITQVAASTTIDYATTIDVDQTGTSLLISSPSDVSGGQTTGKVFAIDVATGSPGATGTGPSSQSGNNLKFGQRISYSGDAHTFAACFDTLPNVEIYRGSIQSGYSLYATIAIHADRLYLNEDGNYLAVRQFVDTEYSVVVYNLSGVTPVVEYTVTADMIHSPPGTVYSSAGESWRTGNVIRLSADGKYLVMGCCTNYTYGSANRELSAFVFKNTSVGWAKVGAVFSDDKTSYGSLGMDTQDNWLDIDANCSRIAIGMPEQPSQCVKIWDVNDYTTDTPTFSAPVVVTDASTLVMSQSRFGFSVCLSSDGQRLAATSLNAASVYINSTITSYVIGKFSVFDLKPAGWTQQPYNYIPSLFSAQNTSQTAEMSLGLGTRMRMSGNGLYVFLSNQGTGYLNGSYSTPINNTNVYRFTIMP